ncbi:nitronate monooxygenase [Cloacibacillus evryensis]|uniref:nitronate monooxygenase n=1 Tax=Cloacibacillus evryensis TaxID=508460 RepID=UPI002109F676|nr:nitronate monooxygenase [Cloacibacillus evryensis]MCQ4764141.1 nitronate monooxygenase [Cloacibacillus evryensis]
MRTKLTRLLGIEYPILMGAMAWITTAKLVAAVSNGGGAGVLGSGGRDDSWVRDQIRETKELTDKPFGINVSLETTPLRDKIVDAIIDEGISFVTLGAGDPRPFIPKFKTAGIKVVCIIPNTKLAKRIEAAGADMIVIEGMESGGRIGNLTTMALMTNVLPEVGLPVVVAGGIADGRGLAAALIMGACGVQIGSRFLLSEECESHPSNAQAIINATDTDSITTGWSRGMGMRGLRSAFSDKYLEMEVSGAPLARLNEFATGCSRKVAEEGVGPDGMNGIVQCGEGLVPLRRIQPAAEIIREVIEEAESLLKTAPELVK